MAMNEGDGHKSYAKNSTFQGGVTEASKEIIEEEIRKKLDIGNLSSTTIRVADFGCSSGPNTVNAMQIIVESIKKKIETKLSVSHEMPEFQVFFNDRTSNDFNTLFALLPSERQYYAAGVPGSFHGRVFPKDSLHFAYSSCALTWLSEIPKEVLDPLSPAWNKGRISYYGERNEVFNAFSAQFAKDLDSFLKARAEELVDGGLLAFIHGVEPNAKTDTSKITLPSFELLGSCLVDLAKKGLFDISKVDSFNLPKYFPFHDELKALVERNQDFSLERMEILNNPPKRLTNPDPKSFVMFMRVLIEGLLQNHFGREIMDELFQRYEEKVEESGLLSDPNENSLMALVLLKCKRMTRSYTDNEIIL